MRPHRFFASPLCVLLFLGLAAAEARPQSGPTERWLRLDAPHFTLFTNGREDVAHSTAYDLEEIRHVLLQLSPGSEIDSPLPTLLYVFADEASFDPYRLRGGGDPLAEGPRVVGQAAGTAGYLVPHEHGNYAALVIHGETRPVRFVYKQYIHQLLHDKFPVLPLWLRHGLAEYYSTFAIEGDEALIGLPVLHHRTEVLRVMSPRLPESQRAGLADVLARDELPQDADQTASFLARSWALVHYLRSTPELTAQLSVFAFEMIGGASATTAFEKSFKLEVPQLEERLRAYVAQTSFRYLRVSTDRQAYPVRAFPLAEHEALYHLGDLLLHAHPQRADAAADHFRRALALAPWRGLSHAGLGYLAEQAGDEVAALDHYRQAAKGASGDFLVQYLYGRSLARSLGGRRPQGESEEAALAEAIAALERAVELRRDFAPAWTELGYARNLEPEASAETLFALERARELLPGRLDVAMNLLLAYARLGDREAADGVIAGMRRLGADDPTLERTRDVRLRMDFQEAGRLARERRFAAAAALFARVRDESRDPTLQQLAAEQLEKIEPWLESQRPD